MTERRRLQNRRPCLTFDIQVANLSYKVSTGHFPNGELAEVFISNHRSNSSADVAARDCGILMSLLLQLGCPAATIAHSLSRNTDGSASGVAAAVLDTILRTEGGRAMNAVLDVALVYAAHGWAVFPVPPDAKKSFKCAARSDGRPWGMTRDAAEIRRDFSQWPAARIGLPTGADDGFVVLDVDTIEGHGVDGATALLELQAKHGALPDTLQAISPSGSIHYYFHHPGAGIKIKGSASELGPGIDVRGDGNMTVAPPSINPDGRRYRWHNRNPLAAMPGWLIELSREKPRASISQRAVAAIVSPLKHCNDTNGHGYGAAALDYEINALAQTPPGGRNHALNRASFNLHQLVGGGELDGNEVERALYWAAEANGLIADDGAAAVANTIESGRRAGLQYPRSRSGRS